MKITGVKLPANENGLGLQSISMYRLGELVVIAGQNGAGKSRLLELIKNKLTIKPLANNRVLAQSRIIELENDIKNHTPNLSSSDLLQADRTKKYIVGCQEQITENLKIIYYDFLETDEEASEKYYFLNFKPLASSLTDPYTLSHSIKDTKATFMESFECTTWHDNVLSKIQTVQDRYWDATNKNSYLSNEEQEVAILKYEKLQEYMQLFLKKELSRNGNQATLSGRLLGDAGLSDGQNILLQLCVALYSLEAKLENVILFMDEPENSLHPNVLLDTIDKIQEVLSNGQIWIATHSINLLAHVNPSSIWYMDNGSISYAGKTPEAVLQGLLGDEDRIGELTDFLSLPSQLATMQYAYECLQPPESVLTDKGDRQVQQIYDYLSKNRPLTILDFGAGKGRLITTLFEIDQGKDTNTQDYLDYYAYNIDSIDREICENNINSIYHNDKKRHFYSQTDLRDNMIKNSCNIVLMTNVFHEIHPSRWQEEFKLIDYCLAEGGYLMIIEDQVIPKGERAYKEGFIVFDKAEFKELFILDDYVCNVHPQNERLKLHIIPKTALLQVTADTKQKALESHINKAKRNIELLRGENASYINGKLHAFWTQQFANASLALSILLDN